MTKRYTNLRILYFTLQHGLPRQKFLLPPLDTTVLSNSPSTYSRPTEFWGLSVAASSYTAADYQIFIHFENVGLLFISLHRFPAFLVTKYVENDVIG